jgi:TP901 family phage tail tape measure protein
MSALRTAALGAAGQLSLGSLFVRLTLDSAQFTQGWATAQSTVASSSVAITTAATSMVAAAGLAFTAIAVLGVREAAKFEQSFAQVRRTVDATEEQFTQMASQFRQLAKEIPVDVNAINKTAAAAGALGIPTKDIVEFTKVMTDMGATTNMTAIQAATSMGKIANIMGNTGDDFGRMGSAVLKLGVSTAATESEITTMASRLAGSGRIIGLTTAEVLGLAASLASVGVRAEVGGTMTSQVIEIMAKASHEGGMALLGLAQIAGVSMAQFSHTIKTAPMQAITEFFEGLKAVDKEGGNVFKSLDNVGIEGQRVALHLLQAAGASEKLAGWTQIGTTAWEENTARAKATSEIYGTFISQLKMTLGDLRDLAISIGQELIPVLETLNVMFRGSMKDADGLGGVVKDFTKNVAPAFLFVLATIGDIVYGWQVVIKAGQIGFLAMFLAIAKFGEGTVNALAKGAEMFANSWIWSINKVIVAINFWMPIAVKAINMVIEGFNLLVPAANAVATLKFDNLKEIKYVTAKVDPASKETVDALTLALAEANAEFDALADKGKFSDRLEVAFKKVTWEIENTRKMTIDCLHTIGAVADKTTDSIVKAADRLPQMTKEMRKTWQELLNLTTKQEEGPKLGSDLTGKGSAMKQFQDPGVAAAMKMAEEQKVAEKHLADLQKMNDKEVEMTAAMNTEKEKLIKAYNEKLKNLQLAQATVVVQGGQKMFEDLGNAVKGYAGEQSAAYKAMFAASKAFAIAESVIKIQQGIAGALGATPFYPVGLVNLMGVMSAAAGIVSTINSVALTFGGGKAAGGPVSPGMAFMVGERGPEMFTPAQRGTIIPNSAMGGSGTQVIINNHTDAVPQVTEKGEGDNRTIEIMLRRVKSEISSEIRDGRGDVGKSMETTFGLRRGSK